MVCQRGKLTHVTQLFVSGETYFSLPSFQHSQREAEAEVFLLLVRKKIIKSMKLYSFCLHLKYGKGQERREEKERHTNWS